MSDERARGLARKYALLNAFQHGGKAEARAVLAKVLGERPELRGRAREVLGVSEEEVGRVNEISLEAQRLELQAEWPELLQARRVEEAPKVLPPLPNVDRYAGVVTRFSPNPDFCLHIGSVRAVILSHDYARIYKGRFFLRFDDTDPRLKKSALQFYGLIQQDLEWLRCKPDEVIYQSDRLEIYYDYARKLIELGGAYACECSRDAFKKLVETKQACPCRTLDSKTHLARWEKMLTGGYAEEGAVLRVKTDLEHPNPAVRDWPAFRVIDPNKYPHPRVGSKHRVWPLYNWASGLDDHLLGITHVIRGKEHLTNAVRQEFVYRYFGWKYPEAIHYGRLKVEGVELSKSRMMKAVEEGLYTDFSDPRLGTLAALRRRGIQPEALRRIVLEIGPRPVDATISWDNIYSQNRKIIDPIAHRYFFLRSPVKVAVADVRGARQARLSMHPDHPEMGERQLKVEPAGDAVEVLLERPDLTTTKSGSVLRLMELFNIQIVGPVGDHYSARYHSDTHEEAQLHAAPVVQWLPSAGNLHTTLVMPDADAVSGMGEPDLGKEPEDSMVQLIRFGFARVDKKEREGGIALYFAHR